MEHGTYSCPWCETRVVTMESPDMARRFMEAHLDDHYLVGVPVTGVEHAPKLREVAA